MGEVLLRGRYFKKRAMVLVEVLYDMSMRTLWWTIATVICSPLLLLLAFLRRRNGVQKVLVIQLGALGDLLCTTPLFRAIKTTYPHAQVHVLCLQKSSIVLKDNPAVDRVYFYDTMLRRELIRMLRQERFDWSINCLPGAFASVIGLWALVPHRINTPSKLHGVLTELLGFFSPHGSSYPLGTHTYAHYMKLANYMNVHPVSYAIDFFPDEIPSSKHRITNKAQVPNSKFVILNITAGNSVKEWPLEKFVALADRIVEQTNASVVFSTADADLVKRAIGLVKHPDRCMDASSLTLGELGSLCKDASAFVSVDTGPMYVAFAMHCPIVVITGPIDPREQVPPESERVAHVPPPAGCQPWVHISLTPREGTEEQLKCVKETTVGEVMKGLERVMKNR